MRISFKSRVSSQPFLLKFKSIEPSLEYISLTDIWEHERKAEQLNSLLDRYKDPSLSLALLDKIELFQASKKSTPLVLSVSGAPGTGKTTLANELANALGYESADDFNSDFYRRTKIVNSFFNNLFPFYLSLFME